MNGLTSLLGTLGSPWLILVLLALAAILLEAERWWTRWQRQRRRRVGVLAYLLDGLSISSAALAAVTTLALLARGVIAVAMLVGALLENPLILAAFVLAILLIGTVIALMRGWLRWPRRSPAARATGRTLSERLELSSMRSTTEEQHAPTQPQLSPLDTDLPPSATAMPSQTRAPMPQVAPPPSIAMAPVAPEIAAMPKLAASLTARPEEPVEGLASLSIMQQRRVQAAAPPPRSFLSETPVVEKRRTGPGRLVAVLIFVMLAGGAFFFRQQLIDLLPTLWPETSYATSPTAQNVPPPSPVAPSPSQAEPTSATPLSKQVASDALNLRANPGVDQQVLATLRRGDSVVLLNQTQTVAGRTWVRVRAGAIEGWVSLEFLE